MPEAVAHVGREGSRAVRARRRPPAARRERPDLDVRRRPAHGDPRQRARSDGPVRVLVRADAEIVPNHLLGSTPTRAPRSAGDSRCCRSNASSAATSRARAGRITSPPGRRPGTCSPRACRSPTSCRSPIFTPATKAHEGHDENIDGERAAELVGADLFEQVERTALALYAHAADYAASAGSSSRTRSSSSASTRTEGSCSATRR